MSAPVSTPTGSNRPSVSRSELESLAARLTHGRILKVASLLAVKNLDHTHRLVHLYSGFMNAQHDIARRIRPDEWGRLDVRTKTFFAFCTVLHAWHGRGRGQGRAPSLTFPCFSATDGHGQLLEAVKYLGSSVDFPDISEIFSFAHEGKLSREAAERKQRNGSLETWLDWRRGPGRGWREIRVVSLRPPEEEAKFD